MKRIATTLLLMVVVSGLLADPRTSVNYGVVAEVVDAGGARVTSANYTSDGSIGGIGGISTVGAYSDRGGFPGQLYEQTNAIEVTAPFDSVGEQVGMGLTARIICSDGTKLGLLATDVTWSTNGPLFIGVGGAAVGQAVYQNTPATAIATRGTATGSLALTVIDDLPDNYGSYAGDGLADFWQFTHFGLNNPDAAPAMDPDRDGQDNRLEYLATTLPTDPTSRFQLRIESVPNKPTIRRLVFSPYGKKRTYTLFSTVTLGSPGGWEPVEVSDQGDAGDEYFFVNKIGAEEARFYRIEIQD